MYYSKKIGPSRKALVIGSPGIEGEGYLYSASTDVTNMKNYLLSSRGGKWKESEVNVLWNPEVVELAATIANTIADYVFIYFAGHGYETANGERRLCFNDADVSDFFLLNNSPRQLVVIDACREKEYPAISGIPEEDEWLHFDGYYPEREAFDNFILQSPVGKIIVHATKSGFASWEDSKGRGGVFTTSLLLGSRTFNYGTPYSPIRIEQLVRKAKKIIKQSGDKQEPEIVYSTGNLQVPFALSIKEEAKTIYKQPFNRNIPRKLPQKENSNSGLITAGIALAVILLIANSSD